MCATSPTAGLSTMLLSVKAGHPKAADQLFNKIYPDLRSIAGRLLQPKDSKGTWAPTDLVNEALSRLLKKHMTWPDNRRHLFSTLAKAMQDVLVERARTHAAAHHGASWQRVSVDSSLADSPQPERLDLLEFDAALEKLTEVSPRSAEVVRLRYFLGQTMAQIAESLALSLTTVEKEWRLARAFLLAHLRGSNEPRPATLSLPAVKSTSDAGSFKQGQGDDSYLHGLNPAPITATERFELARSIGQYAIERKLGDGGMGSVYQARDTLAERMVAIKVVPPHLANFEVARDRIIREAKALAHINHPGVVRLLSVEQHSDVLLLISEYVAGYSLAESLRALQDASISGSSHLIMSPADIVRVCADIAEALQYIHSLGIVHRDVKPSNILVADRGPARLIDFGIAVTRSDVSFGEQDVSGTRRYMSPELLSGAPSPISAASDVFALGLTLKELLTACYARLNSQPASRPSAAGEQKKADSLIPPPLRHAYEAATTTNPADRILLVEFRGLLNDFLRKNYADKSPANKLYIEEEVSSAVILDRHLGSDEKWRRFNHQLWSFIRDSADHSVTLPDAVRIGIRDNIVESEVLAVLGLLSRPEHLSLMAHYRTENGAALDSAFVHEKLMSEWNASSRSLSDDCQAWMKRVRVQWCPIKRYA